MATVKKFTKVLIANRGEIAVRIIRACQELGLKTVAVYSDVDKNSLPVLLADESVCLGEAEARKSYLNMEKILAAAKSTGAEAIHPGFGFLSENAEFARACGKAKIVFIGPTADTIETMGDKLSARAAMKAAGVPIVPGSDGELTSVKDGVACAKKIGYPVILKAAAGGGGKGMRVAHNDKELEQAFETTQREALSYFGNAAIFMEHYVQNPHHIEVQILGDSHGNIVHLFERECSMQRRHQKVIEEAPAPFLHGHDKTREELFKVAIEGARRVNYVSAGTMEFVMGGSTEGGANNQRRFYFLEMNTRIQVEHPVTELITGIDIVKEQLRVAQGEKLSFTQKEIVARGAAMEVRLYAEDPVTFLPAPGKVAELALPGGPGVRIDGAMLPGQSIPLEYDPMIAKICTWGNDREESRARMIRALKETLVAGTQTNLNFLLRALAHKIFISGDYTTHFIQQNQAELSQPLPAELPNLDEIFALVRELEVRQPATSEPSNWWSVPSA